MFTNGPMDYESVWVRVSLGTTSLDSHYVSRGILFKLTLIPQPIRDNLSKLTLIPQPIRDCLSKALNRMLTIFLGTLELTPLSVYPSQIPPVKSVKASATFPPFKASYEPYSLQR